MPQLAITATKGDIVDFLKILNAFGAVMAWIIILVILWAVGPLLIKILTIIAHFH